jgi:thioredoxin reductase
MHSARIETVIKQGTTFELVADSGETFEARTILLATGIQETLPAIEGIYDYYGKSLFNCPFCDGWELRDKPLVILTENEMGASHLPKLVYNWSHDLVVCTNGHQVLNDEQKLFLEKYGIGIIEEKIVALAGHSGQLERVVFENHPAIERAGGLVGIQWKQATTIGQDLGCETNNLGGIATDELGRTTIKGVYAAGDTVTTLMQAQLIMAAASGSKAAVGINIDLTASYFDQ